MQLTAAAPINFVEIGSEAGLRAKKETKTTNGLKVVAVAISFSTGCLVSFAFTRRRSHLHGSTSGSEGPLILSKRTKTTGRREKEEGVERRRR